MTAAALLDRLDKVRRTGPGTWIACCPAHDDRGPSLSVRETDGGRTLVYCFAGCSIGEVVGAAGIQLSDLFPPRDPDRIDHRKRGERRPFPAADALRCVAQESLLVAIAASRLGSGHPLDDEGRARLLLAAGRLQSAAEIAGVNRG
jgi:hypothetical protein